MSRMRRVRVVRRCMTRNKGMTGDRRHPANPSSLPVAHRPAAMFHSHLLCTVPLHAPHSAVVRPLLPPWLVLAD